MRYYPFLKLKQNEVFALKELEESVLSQLTPFFDIAKPQKNISADSVMHSIATGKSYLERHWNAEKAFYIDSFDIPDTININGAHAYKYVLDELSNFLLIPVIGLNRHIEHIQHALNFIDTNNLTKVAIRLTPDDFSDYILIEDELDQLVNQLHNISIDLVLDCRLIQDENEANSLMEVITEFISDIGNNYQFEKIIFTGSSISANIADHIETDEYLSIPRHEWDIFTTLTDVLPSLAYGDYGIVSPNYSDANIDPKLFRNISTPKLFYTEDNITHIFRGESFKSSAEGQNQYFTLAFNLASSTYYRGSGYSFGDNFIYEKSQRIGSPSSQGYWYRILNNCHITYICNDLL